MQLQSLYMLQCHHCHHGLLSMHTQIEEKVRSAAERLQRVRRQGQDLTRLGLTDKEAVNRKLQATLQRTIKVRSSAASGASQPSPKTLVQSH